MQKVPGPSPVRGEERDGSNTVTVTVVYWVSMLMYMLKPAVWTCVFSIKLCFKCRIVHPKSLCETLLLSYLVKSRQVYFVFLLLLSFFI